MAAQSDLQKHCLGFVALDGGLATACEARGEDLSDSLWSARLLIDAPELLQAVHEDFIKAGARIVVTASYQACVELLQSRAGTTDIACQSIEHSVVLASAAAKVSDRPILVAGSVGSYGACLAGGQEYSGQYLCQTTTPTSETNEERLLPSSVSLEWLTKWHQPRLRALQRGGCDLLACETLPCVGEIHAIAAALDSVPGGDKLPVWVSMTLRDGLHCASGEPLAEAVAAAVRCFGGRLLAFGVNCCAPHLVLEAMAEITRAFKSCVPAISIARYSSREQAFAGVQEAVARVREGAHAQQDAVARVREGAHAQQGQRTVHLLAYPNAGEQWNATTRSWEAMASGPHSTPAGEQWSKLHSAWLQQGVTLLGGCCRCGPEHIKRIQSLG